MEHHRAVVGDDFSDQAEGLGGRGHSAHLLCSKSFGGAETPAPPLHSSRADQKKPSFFGL